MLAEMTIDTLHDALLKKVFENLSRSSLYDNVRQVDRRFHLLAWSVIDEIGEKMALLSPSLMIIQLIIQKYSIVA